MGILNVTPDSFHAESRQSNTDQLIANAGKMLADGADILDIGGYSSRPGAQDVDVQTEIDRVVQAIAAVHAAYPEAVISVDTFRAAVANAAVAAGAAMVNDISGGDLDPDMYTTVAACKVPYVLMHLRGTPQTMTSETDYPDVLQAVMTHLSARIQKARRQGINDIIVDPGFGFAKTREQSFELFAQLEVLHTLGCPLMVGVSRKSMISKTLGTTADQALNGTTVLHTLALVKGAHVLRAHDVLAAKEAIELCGAAHALNHGPSEKL